MAKVECFLLTLAILAVTAKDQCPSLGETRIIDNGVIKVGIDTARGGSITYLAESGTNHSVINLYDMGREVQLSFYSGPDKYEPSPGSNACNSSWRRGNWPWNPIGAGDVVGHSGKVVELTTEKESLYVKSIPLQWACKNVPCECTFEKWIRLDKNAVLVDVRLVNKRSNHTQYTGYGQELPAIYTIGSLYKVAAYSGVKPFTNDPALYMPPLEEPKAALGTEHWMALLDSNNWGLGVFQPSTIFFNGGFWEKPAGNYTPKDFPTGYIGPYHREILDWNINYNYTFHLILGTLNMIREHAYQNVRVIENCLINEFVSDRRHFFLQNTNDTGIPNGAWEVNLFGQDPQTVGPNCFWNAEDHPILSITAAYSSNLSSQVGQIFWNSVGVGDYFDEQNSLSFKVAADGQYHTYNLDLTKATTYKGPLYGLRFDPVFNGIPGASVRIKAISFMK